MKARGILLLALLGLAVVWGAALRAPKPPAPLPEAYRGDWLIVLERNEGDDANARTLPPGQDRHLVFREDGTYLLSIRLPEGSEMLRREGRVSVDDDLLTMQLVSENRRATPMEPDRFRVRWETVDKTEQLVLASVEPAGYEIHLRRRP